jgi:hypothetical protein
MPSLLRTIAVLCGLLHGWPAAAEILPAGRRTTWNPGIPGGIPGRTTVCATVNAATYGHGTIDATAGIQAAIDACPEGQVVRLSAGDFLVNGAYPITLDKGVVLRGAGAHATKLRKTSAAANPVILVGVRWPEEAASVNLTANAAKGATSVQVASAAGFTPGRLVLLDETTDDAYVYWGTNPAVAPGAEGRGWFTRFDRPVGQMLEVASVSGNTVTFTTPLHIAFRTARAAQLTRYTVPYGARYAGVEDLYVRGGQDDNLTVRFSLYSWIKGVESDWSMGDSVGFDTSLRCVLRDSYVHDTPNPYPGGAGYLLSIGEYTADSLVENNIFMNANKVMVMRASGGGNVVGYNYFDNGHIANYTGWMETGLNASHMTCPHFELFEGNLAFNIDGDDTWGGAVYNTFFRNHATGKRRSYADLDNRRAIGLMYGHYYYSFVGNVLGTPGQSAVPYGGFAYEDVWPWADDPVAMWRVGYTPEDWNAPAESRVVTTTHRHANFDYATSTVRYATGYDQALPDSLYLPRKPAFFGTLPWPWVNPGGPTRLHTLPAKARYDAGQPIDTDLIFADDFESGTLANWSAAMTDGGDLTVSGATALAGSLFGAGAVVDDQAGLFVQDDTPADETSYRARFYLDAGSFDPGEALGSFRTRVFIAFDATPQRRIVALVLRRQLGLYGVMGKTRLDDGSQVDGGFVPILPGPHAVELEWRRASGAGTGDGLFRMWIDGIQVTNLTGLDNDSAGIDFVRLGALSVKAGASGTIRWDEFESRRRGAIGLLP